MNIIVNGEAKITADNSSISDLLASLELPGTRVAVEVNKILVRRAEHPAHLLKEGDVLEIVTLVGGG